MRSVVCRDDSVAVEERNGKGNREIEKEENELKSYFYVTLGKDEALNNVLQRSGCSCEIIGMPKLQGWEWSKINEIIYNRILLSHKQE